MDAKTSHTDLMRGQKDKQEDIRMYGEDFVNKYPYKAQNGARYNLVSPEKMFGILKAQAEQRGIK